MRDVFYFYSFFLNIKNKFILINHFYIPVPTSLFCNLQKNNILNEIHTNSF